MKPTALLLALSLAAPALARVDGDDAPASIRTPTMSMNLADRQPQPVPEKPKVPVFGEAGSRWWTVGTGVASDLANDVDLNVRGAYSYFLIKDVEFSAELNAWYFSQPGPDAAGINPAMVFRWHFYDDGRWTVYADAGIGLLWATDDVPQGGTSFDFTPRIGAGFTRQLDPDSATRLQVGVRWHHISNARISGAENNPSRDALMLYAGIQFPF